MKEHSEALTKLESVCYKFHASDKNDVDKGPINQEIRRRAYAAGFKQEDVNQAMNRMGKAYRERDKIIKVKPEPPPPEPKHTPTKEAPGRERPVRTAQGFKDIPRGVKPSHEPKVGMNPSGGKLRSKNTPSIVDGDFK